MICPKFLDVSPVYSCNSTDRKDGELCFAGSKSIEFDHNGSKVAIKVERDPTKHSTPSAESKAFSRSVIDVFTAHFASRKSFYVFALTHSPLVESAAFALAQQEQSYIGSDLSFCSIFVAFVREGKLCMIWMYGDDCEQTFKNCSVNVSLTKKSGTLGLKKRTDSYLALAEKFLNARKNEHATTVIVFSPNAVTYWSQRLPQDEINLDLRDAKGNSATVTVSSLYLQSSAG
mgnify:FL=1